MATLSYGQLEQLWISAGGSKALAPLMAAIAEAESGGNPDANNYTDNGGTQTSWGLWQVSNGTHSAPVANINNPLVNAQQAVAKYESEGLSAWGTYDSGAYKQFYKGSVPASSLPTGGASTTAADSSSGNSLFSLPAEITGFFSDADKFVTLLMWLVNPASWVRIGAFIVGVALLLFALHALIAVGEGEPIFPSAPPVMPVPVPV